MSTSVDSTSSVDRAAEARRAAEAAAAQQAKQAQQTQQTQQTQDAQQEAAQPAAAAPETTAAAEPTRTPASPETQQATREKALGHETQARQGLEQGRPAASSLSLVPSSTTPTTAARGLQRAAPNATAGDAAARDAAARDASAAAPNASATADVHAAPKVFDDAQLAKRKQQLDAFNALEGKRPSPGADVNANANASAGAQQSGPDSLHNNGSAAGADAAQNSAPSGAVSNARPGTTTPPEARPTGPATPYANTPQHRERVNRIVDGMARRLGRDPANLSPADRQRITRAAERMAHLMGATPTNDRGWKALDKAVRTGTVGVGLAGIHGFGGGPRNEGEIEQTRRDMSGAGGQEIDAVLDNDHGGPEAVATMSNRHQVNRLRELGGYMNELGITMNVTAHSNGFNALATVAREGNVRFGNVTLVNPNIPGSLATTTEGMRAIRRQSDGRTSLVTSVDDGIVPMTPAGIATDGKVWRNQIRAAAAAGFDDITVLTQAGHNLDSMSDQRDGRERGNLDFHRGPSGQMEPVNPDAWRARGWAWHPDRGFVRLQNPRERPLGRAA